MKKQNCPFCGHRWIRSSEETPVTCPNCKTQFDPQELYKETEF